MKNKTTEQLAIEYYKKNVEGVPLTQDEVIQSFVEGFLCREKEVKKIVLDKLNKMRSDLSDEQRQKLGKVIDKDKIEALKLQIGVLIEIQNKLKI
jgi:hypothetical protein